MNITPVKISPKISIQNDSSINKNFNRKEKHTDSPKSVLPNYSHYRSYIPSFLGNLKTNKITTTELEKLEEFIYSLDLDRFKLLGAEKSFGKSNTEKLYQNVMKNYHDIANFIYFILNQKPAILLDDSIAPILKTGNYKKFDAVTCYKRFDSQNCFYNTFILNSELCKKLINKNKSLFESKLNITEEISADDIYKILIQKNSPLFKGDYRYADIRGILLGYPVKNSILFNLERMLPTYEQRNFKNVEKHKKLLAEHLESENYAKLTPNYKREILDFINKYDGSEFNRFMLSEHKTGKLPGFLHIKHVSEPEEEERMINSIRESINQIDKISKENNLFP